jgi:hypothetical protein
VSRPPTPRSRGRSARSPSTTSPISAPRSARSRALAGGRLVIFTSAPSQMRRYWLNEDFPVAMERSMVVMPELDAAATLLARAGFRPIRIEPWEVPPDLHDLFLYSGTHRPELYLSANFRRAISTSAQPADPAEVAAGCARLRRDIGTGHLDAVRRAYASRSGDHAFVVADLDAALPGHAEGRGGA